MGVESHELGVVHGIKLDLRAGSRFVAEEEESAGRIGFEAI
jgi:hypothetical protein